MTGGRTLLGQGAAARQRAGGAAIAADGLVKIYKGGVRALDGFGFTVAAGSIFALLGPNGAGKSTTVKILTTLSRPTAGDAFIAGFDVLREPGEVRRMIGVVGQRSGVDGAATAVENLRLQGRVHGLGAKRTSVRTAELLERFRLTDAANRPARTYSGGMRRKLDIAIGLVHRPRVLFLDEPTTGLDPEARADLWREIQALSEQDALTVLLTTHYLEEADRLADRLALIDRGRLVVEGAPEELKAGLQGDTVQIELGTESLPELLPAELEQLDAVRTFTAAGDRFRAQVEHGATALPAILSVLEGYRVPVVSATVSRPSLDDVYLQYVGHVYDRSGLDEGEAR
ncbi:ATP-binding cassette domain-containing protein [Actinomadura gamaensis]|uniref:ATP-binding cassette domain-containing protein n=1 Tax=Actinomadura gamaensis TaxID=1763541 RepID=A0ABV9U5I8_9ACTN